MGARFVPDVAAPTVLDVLPGSPVGKGGLKSGDRILRAFDDTVPGTEAFLALLRGRQPGQALDVVVLRGGREFRLRVVVGHRALGH